jgi:hypothetical protein
LTLVFGLVTVSTIRSAPSVALDEIQSTRI